MKPELCFLLGGIGIGLVVGFCLGIVYTLFAHYFVCKGRLPYVECPWCEKERKYKRPILF